MVGNSGAVWTLPFKLHQSYRPLPWSNIIPFPDVLSEQHICALFLSSTGTACTRTVMRAALMNQCFVLLSVHSMCNDAQSSLADIIYSSQTEQAGCDEWQSRIRIEQSLDVIEGRSTRLSFFLFFVLCLSYHFKLQTVSNLFIFLCCTFHCVNSKMFNEFSVLTRLIK